jgi:hypothetical protein
VKLYHSESELNAMLRDETILIAKREGFDTIQEEPSGNLLCGKHASEESIEVYPNGSWELPGKRISGATACDLKILIALGEDDYREIMEDEESSQED